MSCSCSLSWEGRGPRRPRDIFAFDLNLESPIPWPDQNAAPSPTRQGCSTSKASIEASRGTGESSSTTRYMQSLYYDTLWFGEAHAPLRDFVRCVSILVEQRIQANDLGCLAELLQELLVRSADVKSKMHEHVPRRLAQILDPQSLGGEGDEGKEVHAQEWEAVGSCLKDGPAANVKEWVQGTYMKEGSSRLETVPFVGIVKHWLTEMECRELQMQVILTLFALRICTSHPGALHEHQKSKTGEKPLAEVQGQSSLVGLSSSQADQSRDKTSDSQAGDDPSSREQGNPKKRKRKSMPARRWTGGAPGPGAVPGSDRDGGFTWNRKSSAKSGLPTTPGTPSADAEQPEVISLVAEALSTRFDALIEKLCLVALQTELESLVPDLDTFKLEGDGLKGTAAGSNAKVEVKRANPNASHSKTLFGSAARQKEMSDERDELQWLCSSIIEPIFSKTLPRQCNALRSKCFVAGSSHVAGSGFSSTPARMGMQRSHTKSSSNQHLTPNTLAAVKQETDLLRREEHRKNKERARIANEPELKEVLRREFESKSKRAGGAAAASTRRSESVEPDAHSRSRSVAPTAKDWKRAPKQIHMDRRFVRSASASLGSKLDTKRESTPVAADGTSQRSTSVFTSSSSNLNTSRTLERAQSLAPGPRVFARAQSVATIARPFERSLSVAPATRGRSSTPGLRGAQPALEDAPVISNRSTSRSISEAPEAMVTSSKSDRKMVKRVESTSSEAHSQTDEASEAEDDSSDSDLEVEDKEEEQDSQIIVPRKRKSFGDRTASSTLGKWMRLESSFDESGSSLDAVKDSSRIETPPIPSINLPKTRDRFEDSSSGLQRVKSGRNPFAKGSENANRRSVTPAPTGGSQDAGEQQFPLAESCPADLGRMWRGSLQPLDAQ